MDSQDADGAAGRSRRTKHDKHGRFAALERLKSLKGTKHKYEVVEEAPVYEEVSEKEFSKIVQQRQEDEWIVDDNGFGYADDGREIFDEEVGDDVYTEKATKKSTKKSFEGPQKKGKSSDIKSMFKALPTKRKIEDVKLEDDDILGSIMEDLHKETDLNSFVPKPMVLTKKHKFNHHSPVYRPSPNSFQVSRQKTPLASSYVPKMSDVPRPNSVHRKPLQPKVVDFDNHIEEDVAQSPVIEDASQDLKAKPKPEEIDIVEIDSMGIDFDPSGDIFEEEMAEAVEETPSPEVAQENIPVITTSFQGSLSNEIDSAIADIHIDCDSLPLVKTADGKSVFRFFWLDAFEDPYKHPGVVYFFGKVYLEDAKRYLSCCVIVKDIPRRVFILPRETEFDTKTKTDTGRPVSMQDVYSEISGIMQKMKISEFRSKKSTKKYAFSVTDIPDVCEYLEVQYSAQHPILPNNVRGSTFSHVLGTDSSSLEILLLEQKIKGPCWIDVHCPQPSSPPVSWCKVEAFTTKMSNLVCVNENLPIPPVVLMCLNLTTAVNSKTQQNEIVAVSCLLHQDFPLDKTAPSPQYQSHFCVLTKPSDGIFPYDFKDALTRYKNTKVERVHSERSLLIYFLAKLQKMDPDLLLGHDILGFDLDILLHRMVVLKIPNWSRVGRLKRTGLPRLNIAQGGIAEKNATCGRLLCDVKISTKELMRCKSYDLEELSKHILNQKYSEIPPEFVHTLFT